MNPDYPSVTAVEGPRLLAYVRGGPTHRDPTRPAAGRPGRWCRASPDTPGGFCVFVVAFPADLLTFSYTHTVRGTAPHRPGCLRGIETTTLALEVSWVSSVITAESVLILLRS